MSLSSGELGEELLAKRFAKNIATSMQKGGGAKLFCLCSVPFAAARELIVGGGFLDFCQKVSSGGIKCPSLKEGSLFKCQPSEVILCPKGNRECRRTTIQANFETRCKFHVPLEMSDRPPLPVRI